MPRLRDLADQQLYKVDRTLPLGRLQPLFHSGVDLDLIPEQWDQLVRVTASLRNRVVPAHIVLQRLSSASPSDRVAKALTTLGRIIKTIFILRYIHDDKIRRRVQLQLNRGEARHELARWLFFANRGEFRTGDYEEIMNKASCLSLLSNVVLVWNTIKIGNIVGQLRAAGEQIDDADLSRVSPLAHRHVVAAWRCAERWAAWSASSNWAMRFVLTSSCWCSEVFSVRRASSSGAISAKRSACQSAAWSKRTGSSRCHCLSISAATFIGKAAL